MANTSATSSAVLLCTLMLPALATAQAGIAGVVRDASGGVLGGVKVEASSPALIERVRTTTTDAVGHYRIADLPPGVYTVAFTLAGFTSARHERVDLSADFTASVDMTLQLSGGNQTVTVTVGTPGVDVRGTMVQNVMTRELLDAIPTGRSYQAAAQTVPGIVVNRPDSGGTENFFSTNLRVHGSVTADQSIHLDGMDTTDGEADGRFQGFYRDDGDNEEVSYTVGALPAEVSKGGVRINMIGRTGSNVFSGRYFMAEMPGSWQSTNLTEDLQARGLPSTSDIRRIFDYNVTLGGPVHRDRIWFFTSWRFWGNHKYAAAQLLPDGSRAHDDADHITGSLRMTSSISDRNKLMLYYGRMFRRTLYNRFIGPNVTTEASSLHTTPVAYSTQAKWTLVLTDTLLLESGFSATFAHPMIWPQPEVVADKTLVAKRDLILGTTWNASPFGQASLYQGRRSYQASLWYVTGTHALKTGVQLGEARSRHTVEVNGDLVQEYRNGTPASVSVLNAPIDQQVHLLPDLGVFVQDTWAIKRLSVSPGLRWEFFRARVDERDVGAGRFVAARHFPAIDNLPNWKTWAPRFALAYDVFGNGRTAIKGNVSKYMMGESVSFTERYDPMVLVADRRTWNDQNGDDVAQDDEIGPPNVADFGTRQNQYPDPNIKRPYQVESSLSIQSELARGFSVTAGYFHRRYYNLFNSDNTLVGPDDYTPMTLISPLNGEAITIYNLSPAKRTAFDVSDTNSDTNAIIYNGFDMNGTIRWSRGMVSGGVTIGKDAQRTCDVDDPNLLRFCDQTLYLPYQTLSKLSGTYSLPHDFQLSGAWQSRPGNPLDAQAGLERPQPEAGLGVNYLVDSTIARGLTQPQIVVNLVEPGSRYLPRLNQVDLRVGKHFRMGPWTLDANLDVFNLLNTNAVIRENETWGPNLGRPLEIPEGRLFRVNLLAEF